MRLFIPRINIQINTNNTRTVNGKELVVQAEEIGSSSSDEESVDSCNASVKSESAEDNESDISANGTANSITSGCGFWERDLIDATVITSHNPVFKRAKLDNDSINETSNTPEVFRKPLVTFVQPQPVNESISTIDLRKRLSCETLTNGKPSFGTSRELNNNVQVTQTNNFRKPPAKGRNGFRWAPLDDDLLSIHPSDNLLEELEFPTVELSQEKKLASECIKPREPTPPIAAKEILPQPVATPAITPQSETSLPPCIADIQPLIPNRIIKCRVKPAKRVPAPAPKTVVTKETPRSSPTPQQILHQSPRIPEVPSSPKIVCSPQPCFTTPPPPLLAMLPPPSPEVTDKQPDLEDLVRKICSGYGGDCTWTRCTRIHGIDYSMLVTSNFSQQTAFWERVLALNNSALLHDVLEELPLALAESDNERLLVEMVGRVLTLALFDRSPHVRHIIDALQTMRRVRLTFDEAVERILTAHGHGALLCDILLAITVDRPRCLVHWPTLERILARIPHRIDHHVAQRIIDEVPHHYYHPAYLPAIYRNLVQKDLFDRGKVLISAATMKKLHLQPPPLPPPPPPASLVEAAPSPVSLNGRTPSPAESATSHSHAEFIDLFLGRQHNAFLQRLKELRLSAREIVQCLINALKAKNAAINAEYFSFLRKSFLTCLKDADVELRTTLLEVAANLLQYLHESNQEPLSRTMLDVIRVDPTQIAKFPIYTIHSNCSKLIFLFEITVKARYFDLAFETFKCADFDFPDKRAHGQKFTELVFWIKLLFKGLYKMKQSQMLKELFLMVYRNEKALNIDDLQEANKWNTFEYYEFYVKSRIPVWQKDSQEFLADMHESVGELCPHLRLNELRNVLIMMYRHLHEFPFTKLLEVLGCCQDFYRQSDDYIFYACNLTITEVHLVTHAFFFRYLQHNRQPMSVPLVYGGVDEYSRLPAPAFVRSPFWDVDALIGDRVKYALENFPLHQVSLLRNEIPVRDAKFILECIRRTKLVMPI